jgi:ABC-type polysaccharide/polyol phosphate export permease
MNPFSYFILGYQDALYRNTFSSPEQWLAITLLAIVSLAAGYTLFMVCKPRFAEEA